MSHHQLFHRIRQLYSQWDPSLRLSRLGAQRNSQAVISVPQGKGIPGWLVLSRNPTPTALFVNRNGDIQPIRIVWDERCFEDTIFRVEKTSTHLYLADVWMFNGVPIFDKTTFEERQSLLKSLFQLYTPCKSFETYRIDLRENVPDVRGREYYTNERGARGIFIEDKPSEDESLQEIVKTDIPDVYRLSNGDYLRVPTLALSQHLRSLGPKFTVKCSNNKDGTWTPLLSSNPLTNED
jgi:hypothetical protein